MPSYLWWNELVVSTIIESIKKLEGTAGLFDAEKEEIQ